MIRTASALGAIFVATLAVVVAGLLWIEGPNADLKEVVKQWQAGLSVLSGFLGLILVEVLRSRNEARRDARSRIERKAALARGLDWEIDRMRSELKLAINNLKDLAEEQNPTLTQLAFDSAKLADPMLYPRTVDELGLYHNPDEVDLPDKVHAFYHSYTQCQRSVISKLQAHVGGPLEPARVRAVVRLFRKTSSRGGDAQASVRRFLGLSRPPSAGGKPQPVYNSSAWTGRP